ncbi:alkaline phosphatase D family protein [Georgenia sp. AZ-5]|uniref:DUF7800 domain-containing protein n=1 Tax=Georgenia sp. AZ-5 TaxID=3367526 RepID=UPI003755416E
MGPTAPAGEPPAADEPGGAGGAPRLLLGPLLRYVNADSATVWVETDRPCEVAVSADDAVVREPTWTVHGHHYALVVLTGLPGAAELPYEVHLDGAPVWPDPAGAFGPSVIRTFRHDETLRLSFGSCRQCADVGPRGLKDFGADALAALAARMATTPHEEWPDALFLAGDQIYADDPSPALTARLKKAHPPSRRRRWPARAEVRHFEEYTWLYHETWTEPAVRWLLSTVPTVMVLDDHDLRDDWNTSLSWRRRMERQPWWPDRVTGAFASYWVYQHLGNLSPRELGEDEMFALVRTAGDDDRRTRALDEFARRADDEPSSVRWSFFRDFGDSRLGIRLVVVDSRCSRRLDPGNRAMVDDADWRWVAEHALTPREGERIGHLLIGTTVPFLLPHGVHHLEGWSEAVASGGAWGRGAAWFAERVRRAVDLEHWAAFRQSFDALVDLLGAVVRGPEPPASVLVLSGDIHSSYTARARLRGVEHPATAVHQLTMSPFRNPMRLVVRLAHEALERPAVRRFWKRMALLAGVGEEGIEWTVQHGPWFTNGVMTIDIAGPRASVEIDRAEVNGGRQHLRRAVTAELTGGATHPAASTSAGPSPLS